MREITHVRRSRIALWIGTSMALARLRGAFRQSRVPRAGGPSDPRITMAAKPTIIRREAPLRCLALAGLALWCAGCTDVTTRVAGGGKVVMTREEFAEYVEHVFRYHNQVMNDLIEAAAERAEDDSENQRALASAEAKMVAVCEPLNEVVAEALSGQNVGLETEMELPEAVPACEEASHVVDDLIP